MSRDAQTDRAAVIAEAAAAAAARSHSSSSSSVVSTDSTLINSDPSGRPSATSNLDGPLYISVHSALAQVAQALLPVSSSHSLLARFPQHDMSAADVLRLCADALEQSEENISRSGGTKTGNDGSVDNIVGVQRQLFFGVRLRDPRVGRVIESVNKNQLVVRRSDGSAAGGDAKEDPDAASAAASSDVQGGREEEEVAQHSKWVRSRFGYLGEDAVVRVAGVTPSGANVALVRPVDKYVLSGEVFLHLHGYRAPGTGLIAEGLEAPLEDVWANLLRTGAVVASTSYRREGRCVRDGVADAVELLEFVRQQLAPLGVPITKVFLEGRSMGGAVATYAIEHHPDLFAGAVCIGAALLVQDDPEHVTDDVGPLRFTHCPERPLLFLTNASELSYIERYIADVTRARQAPENSGRDIIIPALWTVWREGHNLVSSEERSTAAFGIRSWVKHDTFITLRSGLNCFLPSAAAFHQRPPLVIIEEGRAARAVVVKVHPIFKSFVLNVTADDLQQFLGVSRGRKFKLEAGTIFRDVLVTGYPFAGVSPEEWVAFEDPDTGLLIVSIFGWYLANDAAGELSLKKGANVVIRKL